MRYPIQNPKSKIQNPLILLIYVLLTLLLTHPLLFSLSRAVPNDIGDPLLNTWILAWDSHVLLTNPLDLFQANIFHPLPNTLAYSEHLISTALLLLPLQLVTAEPVVAYNLSLLLTFPLAGFGMYLLTLRWTGRREAAFIGGLIFAFAPYRFAAIAHLQLLTFHWLPFALLFLDKLIGSSAASGRKHQFAFALFLTLQLLASWYLAIYTGLIIGLYLLVGLMTGRISRLAWRRLLLPGLVTLLLVLPFAWPYLGLLAELRAARPLNLALSLAVHPTDFVAAAPFNRLAGPLTESLRTRPGFTEENTLFLGLVAPLLAGLAIYGALRRKDRSPKCTLDSGLFAVDTGKRFLVVFLIAIFLLSLLLTFPTPYQLLATLLPSSTIIRVPPRWIIPALFALASLAALGVRTINNPQGKRYQLPITIILSTLLLLETLSIPLPLAPVENRQTLNPAYAWLAGQPGPLALLEVPLHSAPAPEFPEVKRLYASTLGWWRLVNGYSGYTPPRQPRLAARLADFPQKQAVLSIQQLAAESDLPLFVLVHPGEAPLDRSVWETGGKWRAERQPALLPLGEFEGDYLYQVQPAATDLAATPPLATFGPDRAVRLLALEVDLPGATPTGPRLILTWQSAAPLATEATVFIHLRAADGFVRRQADGPPVSNHYPTTQWQPGEIIQDIHPLPARIEADHLALGLYDPASGERWPAFDAEGAPLADEALVVLLR